MNKNEIKWTCSICTYDNYQASNKCSVCLHPRRSDVIQFSPVNVEKPLVIHDLESTSTSKSHSEYIICPPSSSKTDVKNSNHLRNTLDNRLSLSNKQHLNDNEVGAVNQSALPWTCISCSFYNTKDTASCSQCNCSKPTSFEAKTNKNLDACFSRSADDKTNKWLCKLCTYENWNASKKCVVCRNVKGTLPNSKFSFDVNTNVQGNENVSSPSSSKCLNFDNISENITANLNLNDLQSHVAAINNENILRLNDLHVCKDNLKKNFLKCRSPSASSNSSHSSDDTKIPNTAKTRGGRRRKKDNLPSSSMTDINLNQRSNGMLSRSNSSTHLYSPGRVEMIDNRSFKNRTRNLNWLFLKACIGVVDDNAEAVDAYLAHGGNIARCLTFDEINSLNRPSAFDVGHTLVHLAIRFQRHNILALLLTPEIAPRGFKRNPAHLSPDIADLIRREIVMSLRTLKGDFRCRFLSECSTFQLPIEICDLPSSIQQILFNELLDQDVQKELEEETAVNWSPSLLRLGDSNNRFYALWNRSAGDCLLDSVLQTTWAVFDRDNVLRTAMSESLRDCESSFYERWKEWELQQADILGYSSTEQQCLEDWSIIHSLAQQPGASLEHCHIFVLSHILRRPIIIYGIKYLKSFRGDTLGFAKFRGVYLPFLWDRSFCYTSPIALGYTRGHFTALVTMENDSKDHLSGAGQRSSYNSVKHLPLVDSDGKILPIHFTMRGEGKSEEQRKEILTEWLDCYETEDGLLIARQRPGKRPPSLTRMIDGWLDHYRQLAFKRLGEVGDTDDDDE